MRRLIKVGFLCAGLVAAASVPTVEARVGVALPVAHPAMVPHVNVMPRIGARGILGRGVPRPGLVDARRRARFGRGIYGAYGGYGDLGVGLGLDTLGGAMVQPADAGAPGPGPEPLPPPDAIPAPCLPPMMLKVGRGLAHPPKVRVVYGVPACAP